MKKIILGALVCANSVFAVDKEREAELRNVLTTQGVKDSLNMVPLTPQDFSRMEFPKVEKTSSENVSYKYDDLNAIRKAIQEYLEHDSSSEYEESEEENSLNEEDLLGEALIFEMDKSDDENENFGAPEENRTPTSLPIADFESAASTSSATGARTHGS